MSCVKTLKKNTPIFGSRGSEVQILSPRPVKKGLAAFVVGPFLLWVAFWVAFGPKISNLIKKIIRKNKTLEKFLQKIGIDNSV